MNRDFVLNWRPTAESQPQAAIFSQTVGQDSFLQIMLLPPNEKNSEQELARELIFVIDTSGSMAGQSIDQAKQSLQLALIQLRTIDRFNIIEFNSRTRSLFKNPKSANSDTLLKAKKFVHRLQAKGGTEMAPALNTAFKSQHSEQHVRQIIFITDGAVGNEQAIYKIIHNALADGRLYTIGIGSAPNSYFMRKAAQFGRGTFLHIGSSQQVETKMNQLFDKIKRPLATQLTIKWPQELNIETFPNRLPDLHRGEPVLVNAKIKQGLPHHGIEFSIHGVTKHNQQLKPWQKNLSLQQVGNHRGISKLWAQKKIESLLDKKIAGGDGDIVRQQVLEVALRHQLTSPYTSFIAVEKQISKPTGAHSVTKPITNAPPHGQARQTYAFPATATSAPLNILIGLLLISLALMIRKTTSKGYKVVG